ncbi:hypothetical protein [Sphingobium sp. WCS2017Hpa-17]|uniref:hypothetical protein n=1 Tax=Sphingobium sp. WCS2017Hpa-17 TaxID=3073638 RepID=UPI00288C3EFF|nr:hypothetical protein [Sphingobium sp. WCS2017Hpa-17]
MTEAAKMGRIELDPSLIQARQIVKATLDPQGHGQCNRRAEIGTGRWGGSNGTGCQYLETKRGAITPRLAPDGKQVCGPSSAEAFHGQ